MTGYVVATVDSPAHWKDRARFDGFLCDGTHDEAQFHAAWAKAASTTQKQVLVAPGNYRLDWTAQPYNKGYFSSLRPRPGTRTSAVTPGWSVLHSVVRPAVLAGALKGSQNVFVWGPREGDWSMEGLVLDLHARDQIGGSNRADKRYQMEGIRAWGGKGVRLRDLTIQNARGTSGGGGSDETSGLTLYETNGAVAEDVVVRSTDGGDMATGFHFIRGEYNRFRHCRAEGNGVLVHGFAAWYGDHNVREDCRATDCTSSGLRREVDVDGMDIRPVAAACGRGGGQGGIVSQQTTRHVVLDALSVGSGANGFSIQNSLAFLVRGGRFVANKTDLNVLNTATTGPQPGVPLLTQVSTGRFEDVVYSTRYLSGKATWASYGL